MIRPSWLCDSFAMGSNSKESLRRCQLPGTMQPGHVAFRTQWKKTSPGCVGKMPRLYTASGRRNDLPRATTSRASNKHSPQAFSCHPACGPRSRAHGRSATSLHGRSRPIYENLAAGWTKTTAKPQRPTRLKITFWKLHEQPGARRAPRVEESCCGRCGRRPRTHPKNRGAREDRALLKRPHGSCAPLQWAFIC